MSRLDKNSGRSENVGSQREPTSGRVKAGILTALVSFGALTIALLNNSTMEEKKQEDTPRPVVKLPRAPTVPVTNPKQPSIRKEEPENNTLPPLPPLDQEWEKILRDEEAKKNRDPQDPPRMPGIPLGRPLKLEVKDLLD